MNTMEARREDRDNTRNFQALIRLNNPPDEENGRPNDRRGLTPRAGPSLLDSGMSQGPAATAPSPRSKDRRRNGILLLLMAVHTALMVASAVRNSVTFDEYAHLPTGVAYWHFGWQGFAIHNL